MTLPGSIKDREYAKFRQGSDGGTSVSVTMDGDVGLLQGISYDDIQAEFPSSTVTLYKYYLNLNLVATIEVTFTDSSHCDVIRARKL